MNPMIDPRSLSSNKRSQYAKQALKRAREFASDSLTGMAALRPFTELLKFVIESNYCGGCHDTSAVLHMLLEEAGVESTLCIGEVYTGRNYFDHSWVEVEGRVFDVAVCMPLPDSEFVGGPVFGDLDLTTGDRTTLRFGMDSGEGLGSAARPALELDLQGYSEIQPSPNIWILVVAMASRCGNPNATFNGFSERYGRVRRTLRRLT